MTTKRLGGWWRLWIVLTGLWGVALVGMMWFAGGPWPRATMVELNEVAKNAYRRQHVDTTTHWSTDSTGAKIQTWWDIVDPFDGPTESVSPRHYRIIDSLRQVAESSQKTGDLFVAALRTEVGAARRHEVFVFFRTWLSPSILLLLFGLSIAWVRRGFRPRLDA